MKKKAKQYLLEIHNEIGLLRAHLDQIEAKQSAVLKIFSAIDGTVVKRLEALVVSSDKHYKMLERIERCGAITADVTEALVVSSDKHYKMLEHIERWGATIEDVTRKILKRVEVGEADRGQHASALHGVAHRIHELEAILTPTPRKKERV